METLLVIQTASLSAKRKAILDGIVRGASEAYGGLGAADVLARSACSRRLAEKRFLSATGSSILKGIHQVRLVRAQELLANPDIPVKVVANRCGWNSDIIFRRIYAAAFGHPPRR